VRPASFCSAYASPTSEAVAPQNCPHSLPPPTPAPPLTVRAPRWASRLTPPPLSHGPALHTPGQKWGHRGPRDPITTAARLSALSKLRLTDWRLHAKRPSIQSNRTSRFASLDRRKAPREPAPARARLDSAPLGAVMKDAPGSSHKSCYLYCRPVAVSR